MGLPNSGKSTLWNALCGGGAVVAAHPFSTTESQTGNAEVRDARLDALSQVSDSAKIVPATLRVVDVAGLVKGASGGEGLGNAFLGQLRTTEAVLHVVRCFRADDVVHPAGRVDPADDAETVELELVFADQAVVERRLERVAKAAKGGGRDEVAERDTLQELMGWLEEGHPARSFAFPLPADVDLLTSKPMLYIANVDDTGDSEEIAALERFAGDRSASCVAVNGKLEAEVAELDADDRAPFSPSSASTGRRSTVSAWRPTGCST